MSTSGQMVVLIHGLGRTRHCWWLLRRRLERAGYRTAAWTYSLRQPIEVLGEDCRRRLAAYAADPTVTRVHVVTHSLGGIVLRQAICGSPPSPASSQPGDGKLGCVVMLAPPNHGSIWARRLGPWLGWLAPALPQLSDAADSFVNRMGSEKCEVRNENGAQVAVIAAASDGKCSVATTHFDGECAHLIVPGRHTFIMYRRDVARAVIEFLRSAISQELLKY